VNLRRGFLRLWLVVSLLWDVGVGVVAANLNTQLIPPQYFIMKDATSGFFKLDNFFEQFSPAFQASHAQVSFPNNVTLYVTTDISKEMVEKKSPEFYASYSEPRAKELLAVRFKFWGITFLTAIFPPLIVFGLAVLIGWIAAGFSRDADSTPS
jgi:hypothetical protein